MLKWLIIYHGFFNLTCSLIPWSLFGSDMQYVKLEVRLHGFNGKHRRWIAQGLRLAHPIQLTDLARTGRLNADGKSKHAYRYPRAIVLLDSTVVGGRSSAVPLGRSVGPRRARWSGKRAQKPCRSIWYPIRSDVSLSLGWMRAVQAPTQYGSPPVVAQRH